MNDCFKSSVYQLQPIAVYEGISRTIIRNRYAHKPVRIKESEIGTSQWNQFLLNHGYRAHSTVQFVNYKIALK